MIRFSSVYLMMILILASGCGKKELKESLFSHPEPFVWFLGPLQDTTVRIYESFVISADAMDKDGYIESVTFFVNNQPVFIDFTKPYNYTATFQEPGEYTLSIQATDDDDLASSIGSIAVTTIDLDQPSVYLGYNPSWNIIELDDITFSITVSSPNGPIVFTSIYINDALFATDSVPPYKATWYAVPAGIHKVYATAVDSAGRVGQTDQKTITVKTNQVPEIRILHPNANFNKFIPGQSVWINTFSSDADGKVEKVEIYINDSLITTLTDEHEYYWKDAKSADYTITALAYDNKGAIGYANPRYFTVLPGIPLNAVISALTCSEQENLVFGLNQTDHSLMLINPIARSFTEIDLPFAQPISMDYSISDGKLYIAYKYTGIISVWDNDNQELSSIEFAANANVTMIKTDHVNRRIYVLAKTGLYSINMDNSAIVIDNEPFDAGSIVIDPLHNWLFSSGEELSQSSYIKKYSLSGDELTLIQIREDCGYNPTALSIIPTNNYIVLTSGTGNGPDNELFAFDTENLNLVVGQFSIGLHPDVAVFTPDARIMLGTNSDFYDDNLYIMDANSFKEIDKIYFPNSSDYCRMTTNFSGTKIIAFSYNKYSNVQYVLYFFNLEE